MQVAEKECHGCSQQVLEIFAVCHHQYGRAERNFEFIGEDKDRQLKSLWKNTGIGDVLPWEDIADEAERLLEMRKASRDATKEDNSDGEQE